ncbi:MAG TPA: HYR domain-containing protein [Gemmatimonadaceae bacterium]|nr:HYR domain-containing protein [Gemmatimonadaceae bacterium]
MRPTVVFYTTAQKDSIAGVAAASFSSVVPLEPLKNVVGAPNSVAATVAACGGGPGSFLGYTKAQVAFEPEADPNVIPYPVPDDGWIRAADVPLGFDFAFQGQTYDRVNISTNGFLLFGTAPVAGTSGADGYPIAAMIPALANPNNIIALAWTDWQPNMVADPIRWETRGTAPNRRFILQFTNVPEWNRQNSLGAISPTAGRVTSQVVLSEGSNDITIYTTEMFTTNSGHTITQGIENADGTVANFDSVFNPVLNIQQARVKQFFKLQHDAVRFSLVSSSDDQMPTITAARDTTADNDPGKNYAFVVINSPTASDNCPNVTLIGTRSDGKPLDAPYPVGVTTITWTATDGAGNSSETSQTVTVIDVEWPVWDDAAIASVWEVNATSPSGAIVNFDNLPVTDNVGVTSISCEPASGSLFAIGNTTVDCNASDAAGHISPKSFTVVVIDAHEQIGNLIERIKAMNLLDGTAEPIINQLLAAYDETAGGTASCKKMYDYMTMTQKKNSNISTGDAAYMLDAGSRILSVMGCPAARNSDVITGPRRGTP